MDHRIKGTFLICSEISQEMLIQECFFGQIFKSGPIYLTTASLLLYVS